MAKGDDIQNRLIDFAASTIQLSSKLENSSAEKHISKQILRSGTSPAPNYAEARSAESANDFIHKLKVALKELNETKVWLQILVRSQIKEPKDISSLQTDRDELCRIISASVRTAMKRKNNQ